MTKLFISQIKYFFTAVFLLLIQSCAKVEYQPIVEGTTTAVAPRIWTQTRNGSLFQENTTVNYGYQPLFEDHRPHNVGDIVTVVLQENISASNSSSSNFSKNGTSNLGMTIAPSQLNPMLGANLADTKTSIDSTGKNDFTGKGSNSAKNTFTGLITVTVQQVLPNNNLRVVGERQVAVNKEIEFIRFSGIINPNNINKNNLIASTQIADARIEYFSRGRINDVQKIGWFQKFLLKISPV